MKKINNYNIKRTAFFTILAITSIAIHVIAQSCYPAFDYSATNANVEIFATAASNQ